MAVVKNTFATNLKNNLSQKQYINWINSILNTEYAQIKELSTGVAYCQLLVKIWKNSLDLSKVKTFTSYPAKLDIKYCIRNFNILKRAFNNLGIKVLLKGGPSQQDMISIEVEKLTSYGSASISNYKFIQWFKPFYELNMQEYSKDTGQQLTNGLSDNRLKPPAQSFSEQQRQNQSEQKEVEPLLIALTNKDSSIITEKHHRNSIGPKFDSHTHTEKIISEKQELPRKMLKGSMFEKPNITTVNCFTIERKNKQGSNKRHKSDAKGSQSKFDFPQQSYDYLSPPLDAFENFFDQENSKFPKNSVETRSEKQSHPLKKEDAPKEEKSNIDFSSSLPKTNNIEVSQTTTVEKIRNSDVQGKSDKYNYLCNAENANSSESKEYSENTRKEVDSNILLDGQCYKAPSEISHVSLDKAWDYYQYTESNYVEKRKELENRYENHRKSLELTLSSTGIEKIPTIPILNKMKAIEREESKLEEECEISEKMKNVAKNYWKCKKKQYRLKKIKYMIEEELMETEKDINRFENQYYST